MSSILKFADTAYLFLWKKLGTYLPDAYLTNEMIRCLLVVSCEQYDVGIHIVKSFDNIPSLWTEYVRHGHNADAAIPPFAIRMEALP